jgi:hypothetical protein
VRRYEAKAPSWRDAGATKIKRARLKKTGGRYKVKSTVKGALKFKDAPYPYGRHAGVQKQIPLAV